MKRQEGVRTLFGYPAAIHCGMFAAAHPRRQNEQDEFNVSLFGEEAAEGGVENDKKLLVKNFTFMQVCRRFRKINIFEGEFFSLKAEITERECAFLTQF